MQIIWYILLTVCTEGQCMSQDVQWFDSVDACKTMLVQYQEIPADGDWDSVVYECKLKNAVET
jgi:hypothetical protein